MKDESRGRMSRFALPAVAISFAVILLLLPGCTREQPVVQPSRDDLDRPVNIPPRVTRVVTLAPNLTELVFAAGAGAKVVGTDDFSDYPEQATKLPKVGGMQPNIEKIVALKPDLVFASTEGNQPNLGPALAAVNIPLYVVRTDRVEEIPRAMERVGAILEASGREAKVARVEQEIAAQKRTRAKKLRVLYAVWTDPLYVGGRKTFADDLLTLCGAENAVQVEGWPQYSLETLVANPPDLILYPDKSVTPAQLDALLARAPGVKAKAVAVDENVFTRPGPRVSQAAKALNAILDAMD